jgi:hypothetical protein
LQDVELTIRALQKSTNYSVVDNSVDFYYQVKPIRERKNFVKPVCDSVYLFAYELLNTSSLTKNQLSLVSGYYYLCVKYFERSESLTEVAYVKRNLNMFYKKGYIPKVNYALGVLSLQLYTYGLFSGKFFLRVNRYLFKP